MFYYAHINVIEKHVFTGSVHLNLVLDILKEFQYLNTAEFKQLLTRNPEWI